MTYALFTEHAAAHRYRAAYGGWLALDNNNQYHWFHPKLTPTKVITAPQLRGLSAKLI